MATTTSTEIRKGTRVTVSDKWSHVDGYATTGRVTRLIPGYFGGANVRLDNGNLRQFPIADLTAI